MKYLLAMLLFLSASIYAQESKRYSAVNPVLLLYQPDDVYIKPPVKFQNGKNIISPNPTLYPWEEDLDNGMPNIIKDNNGNLSIYISGFITPSPKAPSRVGAQVYTNNTNNISSWQRPNADLYWYNPKATTTDTKIVPAAATDYLPTNIVAVDIESMGIYEDTEVFNKQLKIIYKPQRESNNDLIAAYEMDKQFNSKGVLQDFYSMKNDRLTKQQKFKFKFIHGDTHMNFLKQNGEYYITTRLNSKRSALKTDEPLPLRPDNRSRYRRTAVSKVGSTITAQNSDFQIALEMSTPEWEPYSMQPYRLPHFENDIWWGLVTMFGFEGNPAIEAKQRTELAISNDGLHWRYLKPGVPFIDNGTDPLSDDYGCINVGKPIMNTKFYNNNDLLFFYAASNIRHIAGRNPGISMASSKYGKIAGIKVGGTFKTFYSMNPVDNPDVKERDMIGFSVANAFGIDAEFYPYILGDITSDPRGKAHATLNSYVFILLTSYNPAAAHGVGDFLGGSFGSSKQGTTEISDEYNSVPFIRNGNNGNTKVGILKYLKSRSNLEPQKIISFKDYPNIPIVLQTEIKNAVYYGVEFRQKNESNHQAVVTSNATNYHPIQRWAYVPSTPSPGECHTANFDSQALLPNEKYPTQMESGSFAFSVKPQANSQLQAIMRMHGDNDNHMGIYYTAEGNLQYRMVKNGTDYVNLLIGPGIGKTFSGKTVIITLEAVKTAERKYAKDFREEATIFHVKVPSDSFESSIQQQVLWTWKNPEGSIAPVDSANARGFAYIGFTDFVAGMEHISIGGSDQNCSNPFVGTINQVEVSEKLPIGNSDFWNNLTMMFAATDIEKEISPFTSDLVVYPNPVDEIMHINLSLSQSEKCTIYITNMAGMRIKNVLQGTPLSDGEHCFNVESSDLENGLYFLIYQNSKETKSIKFLKK